MATVNDALDVKASGLCSRLIDGVDLVEVASLTEAGQLPETPELIEV
jgi:hypothetical protein